MRTVAFLLNRYRAEIVPMLVLALVVAYPCSRFQVVGHYFGLVTLAVGEVVRLLIIAAAV